MGIADLIPGVSGGTIAFITGIYDYLLESLKCLNPLSFFKTSKGTLKKESLLFLLFLGSGIATAFFVFAGIFYQLLTSPGSYSYLYALFFGLIVASIIICLKETLKADSSKWRLKKWTALCLGIVIAFIISFLPKNGPTNTYKAELLPHVDISFHEPVLNYNKIDRTLSGLCDADIDSLLKAGYLSKKSSLWNELTGKTCLIEDLRSKNGLPFWILPLYMISGIVAISAMLLPGISGSYMLTVIGVYPTIIHAVVSFIFHLKGGCFDQGSFFILLNLMVGIILGLILFARVVSFLLRAHRSLTLIVLIGFMIGSLPCIWPFWHIEYLFSPSKLSVEMVLTKPELPLRVEIRHLGILALSMSGFYLVFLVHKLSSKRSSLNLNV